MPSAAITVAIGNIKSLPLMPPAHITEDISALRDLVGVCTYGAAFGAEIIQDHGYASTWQRCMIGMHTYGGDVEVPISVTSALQVTKGTHHLLSKGVARISPNRYRTTVKALADGFPVAFVATHNVNGTDNPGKYAATMLIRLALYAAWLSGMKRHVRRLHRQGYNVIVGGDLNKRQPVRLHPRQTNVINSGLMQLTIVPASGYVLYANHVQTRHGHTDHPLCRAIVHITKADVR